MYKVKRDNGTVSVTDRDGKEVYKADTDSYLVYKLSPANQVYEVTQVKDLTDANLLLALATCVTLKPGA